VTTDAALLEIGNALARNFKAQSVQIIEHFVNSDEVHVMSLKSRTFPPGICTISNS
jgi:nitric oxide synthase oxygenase domain/subunit